MRILVHMWHLAVIITIIMLRMAVPLNYPCKFTHSQVRLYVVERSTGEALKTKYMSADTFYCLHHINAYEDKGNAAWL